MKMYKILYYRRDISKHLLMLVEVNYIKTMIYIQILPSSKFVATGTKSSIEMQIIKVFSVHVYSVL